MRSIVRQHRLSPVGSAPLALAWTFHSPRPLRETWALFSDTDRFNQAVGMDPVRVDDSSTSASSQTTGTTLVGTMPAQLHELLFDYEAPHYFGTQREFPSGLFSTYGVSCRLSSLPDDGGTEVLYSLELTPRSAVMRPLLAQGLRWTLARRMEATFRSMLEQLAGDENSYRPGHSNPAIVRSSRMARLARELHAPEFSERLVELLDTGADTELDRLQPRRLARDWGLDLELVLDGCLQAVQLGLLELRWELLCPSCQGAKSSRTRLVLSELEAHCSSCDIRYDGHFADNIAVSFRPPEELRSLDVQPYCVGSPARTPHQLARIQLEPGAERTLSLSLSPGAYRLRLLSGTEGAQVEVVEGAGRDQLLVELGDDGPTPRQLVCQEGEVRVLLRSFASAPQIVVLEKRHRSPDVLTAAELLERPGAQDFFPQGTLPPDLGLSVSAQGVLVTELFVEPRTQEREIRKLLSDDPPTTVSASDRFLVATWPSFEQAWKAAQRLEGAWQLCSTVGFGAVLNLEWEGQEQPGGATVTQARTALRTSLPGRCALPGDHRWRPQVASASQSRGAPLTLRQGPTFTDGQSDYLIEFEPSSTSATRLPPLGAPIPLDPEALEGVLLRNRYRLGELLGAGGFGSVLAATDEAKTPPGEVVVKILRPGLVMEPDAVQLFLNEARACSLLDSPWVVPFLDFGHSTSGQLFIVMERLVGEDLQDRLDRNNLLPARDVVDIGCAVLDALDCVHQAGLIHRDIKPPNIFLCRGERLRDDTRLIDFGIALETQPIDPDASPGTEGAPVLGSLLYMSPEQLRGEALDHRTDLYSLGLTLYTCLSGGLPFGDKEPMPMVFNRLTHGIAPLREQAPGVPEGLSSVVDRSVAGDPVQRFQSAREMQEALGAALG